MKIETKFNFGSKFWALKDHKAVEMVVGNIQVDVSKDETKITYRPASDSSLGFDYLCTPFKEETCFKSREDLIANL